jgi:hypothetical protein
LRHFAVAACPIDVKLAAGRPIVAFELLDQDGHQPRGNIQYVGDDLRQQGSEPALCGKGLPLADADSQNGHRVSSESSRLLLTILRHAPKLSIQYSQICEVGTWPSFP